MRKVEIDKLREAGFLSGSWERYRTIVAFYKKEMRKKGMTKSQAITNTSERKGATERTVYNAIRAMQKLR